jgi:hypothetical protein
MEYTTALGRCQKCGQDKISVEGINKCLSCDSNNNVGSGLIVRVEDPGAEMIDKLLAKAGVASVVGGKPPEPIKPNLVKSAIIPPKLPDYSIPTNEVSIGHAIDILKALPMPKDIKEFKAINKAISILEKIGA